MLAIGSPVGLFRLVLAELPSNLFGCGVEGADSERLVSNFVSEHDLLVGGRVLTLDWDVV